MPDDAEKLAAKLEAEAEAAHAKTMADALKGRQSSRTDWKAEQQALEAARAAELAAIKEQTQAELDAVRKEADQQKAAREAARRAAAKSTAITEALEERIRQEELTDYAKQEFSKLNIAPELLLSQSLQSLGGAARIRGSDREAILSLYNQSDWLGLMNHFHETEWTEIPSQSAVDRAVEMLRKHEFPVVVAAPLERLGEKTQLVMISLKDEDSNPVRAQWRRWNPHPDGIGFIQPWSANDGQPIFVLAPEFDETFQQQLNQINMQFDATRDALKSKLKLGDIDQAAYDAGVAAAIKQAHAAGRQWALGLYP
jgi:hypothetical protein